MTSHLSEWPLLKRLEITSVGEAAKKEHLCTLGGIINWYDHCRNSIEVPQKIKVESLY